MAVRMLRISSCTLALIAASVGCAQGTDGRSPGGSGDGGPGRDTGAGERDAGVPPTCTDEGHGNLCESPTMLGTLEPGDEVTSMVGYIPTARAEDWFLVELPAIGMPNMSGGGEPRIELTMNDGGSFRFEVRATCAAALSCGDGRGARDLLSWSFVDDQSAMEAEEPSEMDYQTRDMPWPSPVYVRVYRALGAADCSRYQLRITR